MRHGCTIVRSTSLGATGVASGYCRRRWARRALTLGLFLVASPGAALAAPTQDLRQEVASLSRRNAILGIRLSLAASDTFYLLLDPASSKLQLMLKGAVLRDYPILGFEAGTPRTAFRQRSLDGDWEGRVWTDGALAPPRERERQVLEANGSDTTQAAPDSAATTYRIPPTPEEIYPVPQRYHIRYAGGLSVEVRPREADQSAGFWPRLGSGLRNWWADFRAVLHRIPEDQVRLRLVLRPEDAASLYRALPPDTRLLVLPGS